MEEETRRKINKKQKELRCSRKNKMDEDGRGGREKEKEEK